MSYRYQSQAAWPLYLVVGQPTDSRCHSIFPSLGILGVPRQKVAVVTASFAFANLLMRKLESHSSIPLEILRIVFYNRCSPVKLQSSGHLASLDSAWPTPPSVLSDSYCQLCVQIVPVDGLRNGLRILVGVSVSPDIGSQCLRHRSDWAPQYLHERLRLNTLHQHWEEVNTPGLPEALRSAKLAWIGPLYFARSMQNVLPSEVLRMIVTAVICQD